MQPINATETATLSIENLLLDKENPRISEFGVPEQVSQNELVQILWDEMAVNELVYSIISNGFWDYEPLVVLPDGASDNFVVLEGNRRLAAVLVIHNPNLIENGLPKALQEQVEKNKTIRHSTSQLPVVIVNKREEAWRFIGFKHVNGPAKWGSYAKAQYIAEIHNNFDVPLHDIAFQIGDTNNTVQKLYQGLMVLHQAYKANVYHQDDIQANRIFFSHLYTGLQREGIRNFLNIKNVEEEAREPVPKSHEKELGQLLEWLYGSKKNDTQPIIRSQNPDLKHLDECLQSSEGIAALNRGEPLEYAHELSMPSGALFEQNLLAAKSNLQKTRAHLSNGYDGETNLLKVAGSIANLADDLYDEMLKINSERNVRTKKQRITE